MPLFLTCLCFDQVEVWSLPWDVSCRCAAYWTAAFPTHGLVNVCLAWCRCFLPPACSCSFPKKNLQGLGGKKAPQTHFFNSVFL